MVQKVPLMTLPFIGRNTGHIFGIEFVKGIINGGQNSNRSSVSGGHAQVAQIPFGRFPKLGGILQIKGCVNSRIFQQHGNTTAHNALVHDITLSIVGQKFSRLGGGHLATIVKTQTTGITLGDQHMRTTIGSHDPFHVMIGHILTVIIFVNQGIFNQIVFGFFLEGFVQKFPKFNFGRSIQGFGQIKQTNPIEGTDAATHVGLSFFNQVRIVRSRIQMIDNGLHGDTIEPIGSKFTLPFQFFKGMGVKIRIHDFIHDVHIPVDGFQVGGQHTSTTNDLIVVRDNQGIFQGENVIFGSIKEFGGSNFGIGNNVVHARMVQVPLPTYGIFINAFHVQFPISTGSNGIIRGGKDGKGLFRIIQLFLEPFNGGQRGAE
mmetsp:Transcript_38255/g.79563  ORF Transcript_38255/g.79563 Transcript_38255/m.79563 type:complete len:374 (+) Transcript_38255:1687-2808(+)